ncbi:COX17 protein [Lasiosphaeria ovina]|uniref:COX17 protein n=1 Tax=Lasiosphaeria ovina TaxID=92902 RepID=A0AAE0NKS8_9PEZI|nr:COX17 protein [Lasiosphaeria ovina]
MGLARHNGNSFSDNELPRARANFAEHRRGSSFQTQDEKAKRDECMLFSNASDAQKDCQSTVDLYRTCMAGFGFKV